MLPLQQTAQCMQRCTQVTMEFALLQEQANSPWILQQTVHCGRTHTEPFGFFLFRCVSGIYPRCGYFKRRKLLHFLRILAYGFQSRNTDRSHYVTLRNNLQFSSVLICLADKYTITIHLFQNVLDFKSISTDSQSARLGFEISLALGTRCLTFMEPCIARCVFYITNEMQHIQCSLLLSALYMFRVVFRPSSGAYKTVCAALGIVMLSCCLPMVWMGCSNPFTPAFRL